MRLSGRKIVCAEDCVEVLQEQHADLLVDIEEAAANIQMVSLLVAHRFRCLSGGSPSSVRTPRPRHDAVPLLAQEKSIGSTHIEDHCKLVLSRLCSGTELPAQKPEVQACGKLQD